MCISAVWYTLYNSCILCAVRSRQISACKMFYLRSSAIANTLPPPPPTHICLILTKYCTTGHFGLQSTLIQGPERRQDIEVHDKFNQSIKTAVVKLTTAFLVSWHCQRGHFCLLMQKHSQCTLYVAPYTTTWIQSDIIGGGDNYADFCFEPLFFSWISTPWPKALGHLHIYMSFS